MKARVNTFLGLHWQVWASIICTSGGILLVFYLTKGCCPFWAWSLTIMKLGWTLMGLAWCAVPPGLILLHTDLLQPPACRT